MIPLDYYLWGAVKHKCYADKPETIDALKDKIREAIGVIQLHTINTYLIGHNNPINGFRPADNLPIDNVLKNWTDRVGYCMASQRSHLNEIIFFYIFKKRN